MSQEDDVSGFWPLVFGLWPLAFGLWTLVFGLWYLGLEIFESQPLMLI
jgi:hypothetical protein